MMTMPSIFNNNLFDFFDDFAPTPSYSQSPANHAGIMKMITAMRSRSTSRDMPRKISLPSLRTAT